MIEVIIFYDEGQEEYEVTCSGNELFDDDQFDSDVDAHAFAEEWLDAIKREGSQAKIVWEGIKPAWA